MSLVTRGLGVGGILVTAGLALTLGVIVVPPTVYPDLQSWNTQTFKKPVKAEIAVTVKIPVAKGRGLLADIEAKGSAFVGLYIQDSHSEVGTFKPSGAASATIIGVRADTQLGEILAKGEHDLEDHEILALLLTLLDT